MLAVWCPRIKETALSVLGPADEITLITHCFMSLRTSYPLHPQALSCSISTCTYGKSTDHQVDLLPHTYASIIRQCSPFGRSCPYLPNSGLCLRFFCVSSTSISLPLIFTTAERRSQRAPKPPSGSLGNLWRRYRIALSPLTLRTLISRLPRASRSPRRQNLIPTFATSPSPRASRTSDAYR